MLSAGWDAVSRWWDGVELWLTQLGFASQVVVFGLVLLPVCWGAARMLDWAVGLIFPCFGHRDTAEVKGSRKPR